jgi:predicted MFS family arabinose efflux permease
MTENTSAAVPGAVRTRRGVPALPPAAAFAVAAAALAAFFVAAGAPTPLLPIYEARWGFAPWLLTLAFGIYAIALLLTLLVVGSLSDHVGRRPVMVGALALELVSMVVFLVAPSIGWILAARVLQGIATGAATSAFSAAVVELAPERHKRLGSVIGSVAPFSLGIGALFSGAVAQVSTAAAATVWTVLAVVMAVATALLAFAPETTGRRPGAVASLTPRVAVPRAARGTFTATVPAEVGAWMLASLFLGLLPTVLHAVFGVQSPLVSGLAAFAALGTGGVTAGLTGRVPAQRILPVGSVAVGAGAALFVGGVVTDALPLVWAAALVGGVGLGATLSGTIRSLAPAASTAERAGLFAAIYLVAYIAFGVPVIVAGTVLGAIGVTTIAAAFGAAIAVAAGIGTATQAALLVRGRRAAAAVRRCGSDAAGQPATRSRGTDTGRNSRSSEPEVATKTSAT